MFRESLAKSVVWLRGTAVELVDKLVPKSALKLLVRPKFHDLSVSTALMPWESGSITNSC
jgi:hypothetical protein